ncbi:hypothetical protein E3N88_22913 [Mikania micrantha]|uniref:Uncharacterized protein n=1 Tax=Mikania micrantha TaxID=192012 RepID=A0A5N6NBU0_9ASTR|nr:hypothetical protein E3N88_22913 [Mikania micrantha]
MEDELDGSDSLPSPVAKDIIIIVIDELELKINMNDHKFEDKDYRFMVNLAESRNGMDLAETRPSALVTESWVGGLNC